MLDTKSSTFKTLCKYSYSANLPSNKCLKWSTSNRLAGLNLSEKLIIYEFNLNFAITSLTTNRRQWKDENLKFVLSEICPQNIFNFNVGNYTLIEKDSDLNGDFLIHTKKIFSQIINFDFSPSSSKRAFDLVGVLSSDYCLWIYLRRKLQKWKAITNVSMELNLHFLHNVWPKEAVALDLDGYYGRLEEVSLSTFCWHPTILYTETSVTYRLYCGMKSGQIFCINLCLSECDGEEKCELEVSQLDTPIFGELDFIHFYSDNLLLAQSSNGKVMLFSLEDDSPKTIQLWNKIDHLPCSDFAYHETSIKGELHSEFVFNKNDSIIFCSVNQAYFDIDFRRTISFAKPIQIYAVKNFDSNHYCVLGVDSCHLHQFTLNRNCDENTQLEMSEISTDSGTLSSDSMFYDFQSSGNLALIAMVTSNKMFSIKSHILANNVNVTFAYYCTAKDVCEIIESSVCSKTFLPNQAYSLERLDDILFLFRYYILFDPYGMKEFFPRLFKICGKLINDYQACKWKIEFWSDNLYRIKMLNFILKRFWELNFFRELDIFTDQFKPTIKNLVENSLRNFIRKKTLQQLIDYDFPIEEPYTTDQLQSLYNMSRLKYFENFTLDFSAELTNYCPYCDQSIMIENEGANCPQHSLDICSDSLIIIHPFNHEIEVCTGCFESKLVQPRVWPSINYLPFHSFDRCLFCL